MSVSLSFFTVPECDCLLALHSFSVFPNNESHSGMSGEERVVFCLTTLVFVENVLCGGKMKEIDVWNNDGMTTGGNRRTQRKSCTSSTSEDIRRMFLY